MVVRVLGLHRGQAGRSRGDGGRWCAGPARAPRARGRGERGRLLAPDRPCSPLSGALSIRADAAARTGRNDSSARRAPCWRGRRADPVGEGFPHRWRGGARDELRGACM